MRTPSLVLLLSSALASQTDSPLPQQETLSVRLRGQLEALEALGWAGGLLVAHGEEVLFTEGFGLADRRASLPVGRDAISPIASVSKVFTAAAIFELESRGALRLDDPISAHLEGVPESKQGITISHLLTHSAGMPMYLPYEHHGMGIAEALAQSLRAETRFPPGTAYAYSNVDYTLLGILVEKISGQPFLDFLNEHVFTPAGMRETTAYSAVEATGRVPRGYGDEDPGASYLDWPELSWVTTGGGGLVSTLDDLFRFHLALREHRILDEDQIRRAYREQISGMGLGWFVDRTRRGTRIVHHGGASDKGYTAKVQRFLDEDVLMVLFLNTSDALYRGFGPHHALSSRLSRVVFGESLPAPPTPRGEGVDVRPFAGRYQVGESRFEIRRQSGHWIVTAQGQEAVNALLPHERASFEAFAAANSRSVELTGHLREDPLEVADGAVGQIAQRLRGWREQYGELVSMEVLGTTPHWYRDSDLLMTYCRARFNGFDGVFRLHWRGDELAAIGGSTYPQPMFGVLVPDGDGFQTFHLGLASGARLDLLRQEGRPALRVGELRARKVE